MILPDIALASDTSVPYHEEKEDVHITAHALAFLGVAFLGVAFFADVFFVAAALRVGLATAAGCLDLVTRPDLVLPRTTAGLSSTAGAGAAVLRGRPALALGFAVSAFFLGAALEAVAFFAGAAFLGAALVDVDFCEDASTHELIMMLGRQQLTLAGAALAGASFSFFAAGFAGGDALEAAGFASFFASFTGPEGP